MIQLLPGSVTADESTKILWVQVRWGSTVFLEEVRKITQVMHISEEHSVELAVYRLKDLAYDWVFAWRKRRDKGVVPTTWQEFQDVFLDKYFPLEIREAKVKEFMNLRQGSMIIKEYCLKFNQLDKYE